MMFSVNAAIGGTSWQPWCCHGSSRMMGPGAPWFDPPCPVGSRRLARYQCRTMDISSSLAAAFNELDFEENTAATTSAVSVQSEGSSASEEDPLLLERFDASWPVMWRMLCDHMVKIGLISEDEACKASNNYAPMKKAILKLARDNLDLLECIPHDVIQRVAACDNPTPRDRKIKNAFKRLKNAYTDSDDKDVSVGEASFQDLMRIIFKVQLIMADPALRSQQSSKELLNKCTPALQWTLQAILVPQARVPTKLQHSKAET